MPRSGTDDSNLIVWSRGTARELLTGQGNRLAHVLAVAQRAEHIARLLDAGYRVPLATAAHLHDVGYAPTLQATGMHQLDGARWLAGHGIDRRVCNLVAHHSGARFEAEERGLLTELNEFDLENGPVMDALVFADMTTAADGKYVTFDERMDDILTRYPPDDPVHRAMQRARPVLMQSVARTLSRLGADAQPICGADRPSK